jgi:hypothetical protein
MDNSSAGDFDDFSSSSNVQTNITSGITSSASSGLENQVISTSHTNSTTAAALVDENDEDFGDFDTAPSSSLTSLSTSPSTSSTPVASQASTSSSLMISNVSQPVQTKIVTADDNDDDFADFEMAAPTSNLPSSSATSIQVENNSSHLGNVKSDAPNISGDDDDFADFEMAAPIATSPSAQSLSQTAPVASSASSASSSSFDDDDDFDFQSAPAPSTAAPITTVASSSLSSSTSSSSTSALSLNDLTSLDDAQFEQRIAAMLLSSSSSSSVSPALRLSAPVSQLLSDVASASSSSSMIDSLNRKLAPPLQTMLLPEATYVLCFISSFLFFLNISNFDW